MYKKILISTLLITPLFALNFDPPLTHAGTSSAQVNANIDLEYLKKNLGSGMSKSKVKQVLGNEYTEGINYLNSHESWTYIIGKVEGYEFNNPNNDAVDVDGIKSGKLKYHVSITFNKDVLESVYIRYLDSNGKVAEYFKADSGYVKDNGNRGNNSKFIDFGDRGEDVRIVQSQLISNGFSLPRYGIDGVFGEETERAVRAFQKQHGIRIDGIVGPVTSKKLDYSVGINDNEINYPGSLIKKGSTGQNVKYIQEVIGVKVDGIFGIKTEEAVKDYQKRHNLRVDGLVGKNTWNNMF